MCVPYKESLLPQFVLRVISGVKQNTKGRDVCFSDTSLLTHKTVFKPQMLLIYMFIYIFRSYTSI